MTKKLTPVEKARNVLLRAFRKDPDFRHGYVANIACVIYDHEHTRKRRCFSMAKCTEIAEDVFERIFE